MTMAGPSNRRRGLEKYVQICLFVLVAAAIPARAHAGDAPDAGAERLRKMTALSIRIAHAVRNEGNVKKYKSLARQQRAGKRPPAALLATPGTRASRPGRTP